MNNDSNFLRTEASMQSPNTVALIVAAGSGTRFGGDKLMASIHGKPLITYSLKAFASTSIISAIILVVPPGHEEVFHTVVDSLKIPHLTEMTHIVPGGDTRHTSVQCGLQLLGTISIATQFVAIHDAARPLITPEQIESVCKAAYKEGAAALALPVVETLHRIDGNGCACETVDRKQLWSMQTPQVFKAADLIFALKKDRCSSNHPTDDVSALLAHGIKTVFIENHEPNLKVTYQADLKLIEKLLRSSWDS